MAKPLSYANQGRDLYIDNGQGYAVHIGKYQGSDGDQVYTQYGPQLHTGIVIAIDGDREPLRIDREEEASEPKEKPKILTVVHLHGELRTDYKGTQLKTSTDPFTDHLVITGIPHDSTTGEVETLGIHAPGQWVSASFNHATN